ncbi:MAG TPA: hypothetical protein VJW95_04655 [Dissulfurispiraceae bacterium]|nr:hypothetical protein [Dissulfurispiraceae bacterium]
MGSAKDIGMTNYCDSVFDELTDMKSRALDLVGCIERMKDEDKEIVKSHITHLRDIANVIDWKLEILTKVCPAGWTKYSKGAENVVSVKEPGELDRKFAAAGDMGG